MTSDPSHILLTDLPGLIVGKFLPGEGTNRGWVPVPFSTQLCSGTGLATGALAPYQELTLDPKLVGGYDIHIAISRSQARFRVDGQEAYWQVFPEHGSAAIQEVHLGWFDMTGKKIHVARTDPPEPTHYRTTWGVGMFYIRAVPNPAPAKFNRTMVATNDGWSYFALKGFKDLSTIRSQFEPLAQSDVGRLLYSPANADCTMNPFSTHASTLDHSLTWAFRDCDLRAQQAIIDMRAQGVDPNFEAVRSCRRLGIKIDFYLRVQGHQGAFPWLGIFDSKTFLQNPDWHCQDELGDKISFLSWAHPDAQNHMLNCVDELLAYEPDGICLALTRGIPLMVCEPAVLEAFKAKFGRAAKLPEDADSPEMIQVRQELFTRFIQRLHGKLKARGKALSFICHADLGKLLAAGIDIKTMVEQDLVSALYVIGDAHQNADFKQIQASGKAAVYPNGNLWDTKFDPKNFAKDTLTKIHDAGFPGSFTWDIEQQFENPYNWAIYKRQGSADFLKAVAEGKYQQANIDKFLSVGGIKISKYNPNVGY